MIADHLGTGDAQLANLLVLASLCGVVGFAAVAKRSSGVARLAASISLAACAVLTGSLIMRYENAQNLIHGLAQGQDVSGRHPLRFAVGEFTAAILLITAAAVAWVVAHLVGRSQEPGRLN